MSRSTKSWALLVGLLLLAVGLAFALWPSERIRSEDLRPRSVAGLPAVEVHHPGPVASVHAGARKVHGGPAVAAGSPVGILEVVARWSDSGRNAAGIAVVVTRRDPRLPVFEGLTDDDGRLVVLGVPAGEVSVGSAHGGGLRVNVLADATAHAELLLEPGISFQVCVLEPSGRPVSGAEVWVSNYFNFREGAVIGRTDDAGCYGARHIQASRYLAVFAAGYEPSGQLLVGTSVNDGEDVRVVLQPGGAVLLGEVVDVETGEGVDGALVVLGVPNGLGSSRVIDGVLMPGAPPRRVITDAKGAVELAGLPRRGIGVAVKAPGYTSWTGHTDWAGGRHFLRAELVRGCHVEGVVIAEDGKPVSGALVEAGDRTSVEYIATRADAGGRFRMRDLPCHAVELRARRSTAGQGRVTADASLENVVTITLSRGDTLTGYVSDLSDQPLAGWWVALRPSGKDASGNREPVSDTRKTDNIGRFLFTNCDRERLFDLEVFEPLGQGGIPLLVRTGVSPAAEPVRISIESQLDRRASIRGTLVAANSSPIGGETVALVHQSVERESVVVSHRVSGVFVAEKLPVGSYILEHITAGVPARRPLQEVVVLEAGQTVELGAVRIEDEGRVTISALHLRGGGRDGPAVVEVLSIDGEALAEYMPSSLDGFSFEVAPGTYRIRVHQGDSVVHDRELTVVDGERRTLAVGE